MLIFSSFFATTRNTTQTDEQRHNQQQQLLQQQKTAAANPLQHKMKHSVLWKKLNNFSLLLLLLAPPSLCFKRQVVAFFYGYANKTEPTTKKNKNRYSKNKNVYNKYPTEQKVSGFCYFTLVHSSFLLFVREAYFKVL